MDEQLISRRRDLVIDRLHNAILSDEMFYLIISSDIGASSSRYFEFSLCDQRKTARAQDKEKKDIFAKFTHTDVRVESECMLDIVCFVYTGIN